MGVSGPKSFTREKTKRNKGVLTSLCVIKVTAAPLAKNGKELYNSASSNVQHVNRVVVGGCVEHIKLIPCTVCEHYYILRD